MGTPVSGQCVRARGRDLQSARFKSAGPGRTWMRSRCRRRYDRGIGRRAAPNGPNARPPRSAGEWAVPAGARAAVVRADRRTARPHRTRASPLRFSATPRRAALANLPSDASLCSLHTSRCGRSGWGTACTCLRRKNPDRLNERWTRRSSRSKGQARPRSGHGHEAECAAPGL